ncbi:Gfo/Idh/MocA family protein [Kocuria sp. HSID16901]|uniref:Gfo/Idh/MocA family protein n=1 Tax=Kocuria sp. HSID16901 TaxID=2419505 RepID=UPI000660735A|nr:Gfo/Idh/MocA family oxidoreductase [Kocuria sp. HSID16901]MCT1367117.1 Gfo/Idh/MocA family oxidoreductase [Rothia sp. p3-SID1597]RUQ21819.1 gfo/Idh/MocA family oxidoreductase [Kocuria sp. HSID16901]
MTETQNPLTATGRTLGWGIVSTGAIARKVTPDIAALEDARLVAVSSRNQNSAEEFAQDFGVAKAYGDDDERTGYERILADPDVEVLYIATPHGQHYENMLQALEAGKHIVCEKAFTITAEEAREVLDLAGQKNLFVMEGLWTRFHPLRARVAELIESGEIGTPRWVQADLGFRGPADKTHRLWREDAGGGATLDMGCYVLHWPWLALGRPIGVVAQTIKRGTVDALTQVTVTCENAAAQMTMSLVSQGPREAVISGHEGFISIPAPMHQAESFTVTDAQGHSREESWPLIGRGYSYEMREATRCIQEGLLESPVMPWEDTIAQMEFLDEVRRQIEVTYPGHDHA